MNVNVLMEIIFNITYLIVIFTLVIMMALKRKRGLAADRHVSGLFIAAFLLLGIGDTGHVGFRVIALLNGGLEANQRLVGIGSFATAVTVTVFYMLFLEIYRVYAKKNRGALYWFVMVLGLVRIVFMFLPGNNWGGDIPLEYSYIRNAFLTIIGLIVAVLFLKEGIKTKDTTSKLFSLCIFLSYGFYLPVILFVHLIPMIGLLMIPKTCAYVAAAVIGYRRLFVTSKDE